ncbi:uncharacterized protein BJX67DRAFT_356568 [Aspergillus lucknowensis]|uniref:Mid2 domain-containing protein n=1 Tax=Aspergillus lucknowensis TaxID=176173 RepID=A0ABR4LRU2_9EURO
MASTIATPDLTTITMSAVFTPPAACSSSWTYEPQAANDVPDGLIIQNAVSFVPSCYPSGFNNVGRVAGTRIFSPGYCPMGYTSADVGIEGSTTTAICCLSGFDYSTSTMEYADFDPKVYAGCLSEFPSTTSTILPIRQETRSTQIIGPVTMWAQPITIQLESSDSRLFVPIAETSSAPSAATPTSTSSTTKSASETGAESVTATDTNTPTDSESSGLSRNAGIGIGVGVGVGGISMFAAILLWFLRRRKSSKENLPTMAAPYQGGPYYHNRADAKRFQIGGELDGSHPRDRYAPHELGA